MVWASSPFFGLVSNTCFSVGNAGFGLSLFLLVLYTDVTQVRSEPYCPAENQNGTKILVPVNQNRNGFLRIPVPINKEPDMMYEILVDTGI
jgi:hypothetical protein